jgi:1,2-phenylacetyl-CoA epoxidase catalytic subunit
MLLGSTKGQDWVKFFVIGWLVAGAGLIAAAALFPGSGPLGALAGWMTKVLG